MLSSKQARSLLNNKAQLRADMRRETDLSRAAIPSLVRKPPSELSKDVLGCPSKLIGISNHNFRHKKTLGGFIGQSSGRLIAGSGFKGRTANAHQVKSLALINENVYSPDTRRFNNFI